ncbi:HET-domain-containing protein [Acephala macrosclerotiorum]|nr:HET-domain-containing protein [Acephala macrosclerotiorum]
MAPYKYSPLNHEAGEIRLVTLLPGLFQSPIRVFIEVVPFTAGDPPSFEALSYTWGSTEDPVDIFVGSQRASLQVTGNLAEALPYLRYDRIPRTLWIDAICIDQSNVEERSRQVERMGDIYTLAEQVVIWLGPWQDKSTLVISFMNEIANEISVDWSSYTMLPVNPDITRKYFKHPDFCRALKSLLQRPWFERLWIWQEARLGSSRAVLLCGFDTIHWEAFGRTIFCLRQDPYSPKGVLGSIFGKALVSIHHLCDPCGFLPFDYLVRRTCVAKCADPRDKVYALLNMRMKEERDIIIKPDYSKSVQCVYQDVVVRHIEERQDLAMLSLCDLKNLMDGTPSWVPDFSRDFFPEPFAWVFAAGNSVGSSRYLGSNVLSAKGICSATVSQAIVFLDPPVCLIFEHVANLLQMLNKPLDERYVNGQTILEAFCMTLGAASSTNYEMTLDGSDAMQKAMAELTNIKDSLRRLLAITPAISTWSEFLDAAGPDLADFLYKNKEVMTERSFFTTDEGYIGLGPRGAENGDIISVFLGTRAPLMLRPTRSGTYQVVGECFVHGLMAGEALLGPLPSHYHATIKYSEQHGCHPAFYNSLTKATELNDPRLEDLALGEETSGLWISDGRGGKRLTAEVFKVLGVEFQDFRLV